MKTTNAFIAQQCDQAGETVEFCAAQPANEKLLQIIAAAYQIAGAYEAPTLSPLTGAMSGSP